MPEWMFIPYISQMLSNYEFEKESYLDELLMKLAVEYPNGKWIIYTAGDMKGRMLNHRNR